jgi:hypothetical protein
MCLISRLTEHVVLAKFHLSGDAVYRYESSTVLGNLMRDYQPICRIRSRMSPL